MGTVTSGCRYFALQRAWRRSPLALGAAAAFWISPAHAASWIVSPEVTIGETYSSNVAMTSSLPERGWISNVAPGISIDGASARVSGYLAFRREYLFYGGHSDWNRHQNELSSHVTVEAVDNWLWVYGAASISQQSHSVFDPTSLDRTNALSPTNPQIENRTSQISPYIRGRIPGVADYQVRFNAIDSRSDDPTVPATQVKQMVGQIKNQASAGAIGWFGDTNSTQVRNNALGTREDLRYRGGLIAPLSAQLLLSSFAGREITDFISQKRETYNTYGLGIEWSPSQRTQVAAVGEKRFFGNGHSVLLSHRTGLTAWQYIDQKDVSILPTLLAGYNPGSIYDLMSDLLEASIADPTERARAVRDRMAQLGIGAALPNIGSVPASRFFIDRFQEASVALLGRRDTFTFRLTQRTQRLLQSTVTLIDDFSRFDQDIRERRGELALASRLTRQSSLSVSLTRSNAEGLNTPGLHTSQNSGVIQVSTTLSRKARASVGARRSSLTSTVTGPVRESALFAAFTQRF